MTVDPDDLPPGPWSVLAGIILSAYGREIAIRAGIDDNERERMALIIAGIDRLRAENERLRQTPAGMEHFRKNEMLEMELAKALAEIDRLNNTVIKRRKRYKPRTKSTGRN